MALLLLACLIFTTTAVIDITNLHSLSILENVWLDLNISSNPSSGLVWGVAPGKDSQINVERIYGTYLTYNFGDEEFESQIFNISCFNCGSGSKNTIILFLKKAWQNSSVYARAIDVFILV